MSRSIWSVSSDIRVVAACRSLSVSPRSASAWSRSVFLRRLGASTRTAAVRRLLRLQVLREQHDQQQVEQSR